MSGTNRLSLKCCFGWRRENDRLMQHRFLKLNLLTWYLTQFLVLALRVKAWFRIRRAMEIPWHDDKWCILTHYFFEGKCLYWSLDIRYNLRNNHLSPGAAYYMGIWLKIGLIWPICVGHTYVHLIITKVKGIKKSNNLSENRSFSFVLIVVQST